MAEITIDETQLKELLKVAIIELLQEQKEVFVGWVEVTKPNTSNFFQNPFLNLQELHKRLNYTASVGVNDR